MPSTSELAGVRVLVGRARSQAGHLSGALRQRGADVIEIPFIEIQDPPSWKPLDQALARLGSYEWLILTSVNGAAALFRRMEQLALPTSSLAKLKIAAIGPATRHAIEARQLPVAVMPQEYIAESVVEILRDQVRGARVLLVRAKIARDVIPRELGQLGAKVDVVEAYETIVPENSRAELQQVLSQPSRRPHVITFTSSSTVRNFLALAGPELARQSLEAGVLLASIGPVTSATLRELGLAVHIEAREYTIPGLVEAVAERLGASKYPASR